MNFETALEIIYHLSGILVALFFLFAANILRKEKQEVIKSRIFLNYGQFKTAFYIAFIGAIFFLIGNIAGFYSHAALHWIHDVTEVLYNLSLLGFIGILYFILRTKDYERVQ